MRYKIKLNLSVPQAYAMVLAMRMYSSKLDPKRKITREILDDLVKMVEDQMDAQEDPWGLGDGRVEPWL